MGPTDRGARPEDLFRDVLARLTEESAVEDADEAQGGGESAAPHPVMEGRDELPSDDPDPRVSLAGQGPEGGEAGQGSLLERLADGQRANPRYLVLDDIAQGGMGAIYKVWDADLRRTLAMKVAHSDVGSEETARRDALHRFLEEAQVSGQLDHPGIVPVHELGLDDRGRVFFTMRLVRGRDLSQILNLVREGRESWTRTRALSLLIKVCEAMSYAHAKGVIHRDLKPSNVMVGRFGEVYVMDWGLAKVLGRKDTREIRLQPQLEQTTYVHTDRKEKRVQDPDTSLRTLDGSVVGTPAYMPPEQARGEVERVDVRSDVYSVGAILYHILTGSVPYVPAGARVSAYSILRWVIEGPPRPVRKLAPDVPAELVAICEKAMAREPEERYAGVEELAEDLHAYLDHRVVSAYRTGALAELRKWVERNRGVALASAGLVLALIVGAVTSAVLYAEAERNARELAAALGDQDKVALMGLEREALELWPARAEQAPLLADWIARAEELAGRLPIHRRELRSLARSDGRYEGLVALVDDLERFTDPERGLLDGVAPDQGPGVRRRLERARWIQQRMEDAEVQRLWAEARETIADEARSPRYGGLSLAPQWGLVPLGTDPESGLWEFADLQTGEPPARDPVTRELELRAEHGVVFVLIPGGTDHIGCQRQDPLGENYVPPGLVPEHYPVRNEFTVHRVELGAFFLSKYELTQAQWLRWHGANSSACPAGRVVEGYRHSLLHPVENVGWNACVVLMERLGWSLPTDAQWEYAARAGTDTPWWSGETPESLIGAANFADRTLYRYQTKPEERWPALDDGWALHAPVDEFAANAFGLFGIQGNIAEWCRDGFRPLDFDLEFEAGDGERIVDQPLTRCVRGGSFVSAAFKVRAGRRLGVDPDMKYGELGLRPARRVNP